MWGRGRAERPAFPGVRMTDISAIDQGGEAEFGDFVQLLKPPVMSLVGFTAMVGRIVAPVYMPPFLAFTSILFIDLARARPMTPEERADLLATIFKASGWTK